MNLRRDVPLVIVGVLLVLVAFGVGITRAFGQSLTGVGTLMAQPSAGGSGPPPSNPFGIITEDDQPLTTESDIQLETEAAP